MNININRLKDIRLDSDLKQQDIAKVLKITQQQYSKYELGIRLMPIDKIVILAKYYDTSVDYLLGITDIRKAYPRTKIR